MFSMRMRSEGAAAGRGGACGARGTPSGSTALAIEGEAAARRNDREAKKEFMPNGAYRPSDRWSSDPGDAPRA